MLPRYTFTVLERWTRGVVRHRGQVIAIWLILIFLGTLASTQLSGRLTTSLTIPGSSSARASAILAENFHENSEGTFTIFLNFKNASKQKVAIFKEKISAAAKVIPTAQVTQQRALDGVLFASIGTAYGLTEAAAFTTALRAALMAEGLNKALVTGPPAIYNDVTPVLAKDLRRGEIIAILLALFLLLLLLGFCRAVAVPFIFAAATISTALGGVFLLAQKFLMVLYIPNIVELIGLGLAIDYSLLIVHRFRRELMADSDLEAEEAVIRTMDTAGRTIIISGLTVALGLATLLLVPIPFIRSLGAAGLLVPAISILAALTLQPAMLSFLGRKGVSPQRFKGLMARQDLTSGLWAGIARIVLKRPKSILIISLSLLAVIAASSIWLRVTPSSLTALPANLESAKALSIATDRAGPGIITPIQVVIDLLHPGEAILKSNQMARTRFTAQIGDNPEVLVAATGVKSPYVDSTGQYLRIFVIGRHDLGAASTQRLVESLRSDYLSKAGFGKNVKLYLGGEPAQGADLLNRLAKFFPWIVLLILIVSYLVLLRSFRSVILPLKAIALDLISIGVAFGALVLVFRNGLGSALLGTYQLPQIEAWVLIFLFALLFGLSMDYEVFMVSRIREARNRGLSNNEAIVEGLSQTGAVISAAALILVGALSGFVFGHFAGLQQLGIGLAIGVLIDATVIRGLLLPSAMVLLGRWNWWLPPAISKLAKIKASPLGGREARL